MKLKGTNGREYALALEDYPPREECSSLHRRARALLKEFFPAEAVLEEVPLPGCSTRLFADFFVPSRKLVVEVQGEQHYHFVFRFHDDRSGFERSKARDAEKRRWCEYNNFRLVELSYKHTDQEWAELILEVLLRR